MAEEVTPDDMRAIRARLGWSPAQLAEHLGCNQSTVWRMENGRPISGPVRKLLLLLKDEIERDAKKAQRFTARAAGRAA